MNKEEVKEIVEILEQKNSSNLEPRKLYLMCGKDELQ